MKPVEMDKFTIWMAGAFPSWQPDRAVAAIWAKELPDVAAEIAIEAVRRIQAKDPKPFPPGLFEIIAVLKGKAADPHKEALIAFAGFWDGVNIKFPNARLEEIAKEALSIATGRRCGYGQALTADRSWHERRFCEIYEGLYDRDTFTGSDRLLSSAAPQQQLPPAKIAELKERVATKISSLYPSGVIPENKIDEVRALIAAQIKAESVGLGPEGVGSIVKSVFSRTGLEGTNP